METIALVMLTGLVGMYFRDKTEGIRNVGIDDTIGMSAAEVPNSLNMYNSNYVESANDQVLKMSLNNYKDAINPAITGILPPIYNSYSSIGDESVLHGLIGGISSQRLADIDENNKRTNVNVSNSIKLEERPMFKSVLNLGTETKPDIFSNFGSGIEIGSENSLLTGQPIEREHANMVPFFGGSTKQNTEAFTNESKLDNFTGNTSTFIHKQEQLPRFERYTENIYGAPLLTDHIDTSRFIPSAFRQNEKPFYEERISATVAGTFDNPINDNYQKSINDLNVKQQITYDARMNSGQFGNVRGSNGAVSKNKVDTTFELGEDRFFTSTGAVIGKKSSENYDNMQSTSRQGQNIEYYGGIVNTESLASGPRLSLIDNSDELNFDTLFQQPKRNNLGSDTQRNIGSMIPSVNDYGKDSVYLTEMERDTTNQSNELNVNKSNFGHQVGVQDTIKGTIKETFINQDKSGNMRTNALNKDNNTGITDYDFKTTQKETLINNKYKGQANKKDGMGYVVAKYDAKTTHKETYLDNKYNGTVSRSEGMGYDVANYDAKITNKETTSNNSYQGNAADNNKNSMVYTTFENPEKVRNALHVENYQGNGNYYTSSSENRQQYNNADISNKKEILLEGERPSGPKSTLGSISIGVDGYGNTKLTNNMLLKEQTTRRAENINNISNSIPSKSQFGQTQNVHNQSSEKENSRLEDLVTNQLNKNPFYNLK